MKINRIAAAITATAGLLAAINTTAAESAGLTEPAKSVLTHYLVIQTSLAKDSAKGLGPEAAAISKAVREDEAKTLPPEVAKQADALGAAKDLKEARAAFKPLSATLIKYLADHKAPKGTYYEAYCPMAKASWLQAGKKITNPYFGQDMLSCGEIKN